MIKHHGKFFRTFWASAQTLSFGSCEFEEESPVGRHIRLSFSVSCPSQLSNHTNVLVRPRIENLLVWP